jgi:hypothetical protein
MQTFLIIVKIFLAGFLISVGCENISKPSDMYLAVGITEIIIAFLIIYNPVKTLIKQL